MRYIKDIANNKYKISLYQWNNKYIIKMESGMYEQTYKIEEYEVSSTEEIEKCVDEIFIDKVAARFESMRGDFSETLKRNEVII